MVSTRGAAFATGALGLALFVGAILWSLVVPVPACAQFPGSDECKAAYGGMLGTLMAALGIGLLLEAVAVVLLFLHLSRTRAVRPASVGAARPRPAPPRPAAPAGPGAPGAPSPAAPPRNRFLEPPVPPRNGSQKPR